MATFLGRDSIQVSIEQTDFAELAELLHRSGSPIPLEELHGGLCGVLCAAGNESAVNWLSTFLDDCRADSETLATLAQRLELLRDETWQALNGLSLEFYPLLPGDDVALQRRAEALGSWCHGFLAGLVIGGVDLTGGAAALSPELAELVGDFAEVSKAGADADEVDDPESGDSSFVEIVEFVRVGTQFFFEELLEESQVRRTIH